MTTITISQAAPPTIQPRQHVRNGLFPTANLARQLIDTANHIARFRPKEVARFTTNIQNGGGGKAFVAGERDRWRSVFHSSPFASHLWTTLSVAHPGSSSNNPFVRVRCSTMAGSTIGDAIFHTGVGSANNTPANFTGTGPLELLDPATGLPATIPPDTDLQLLFSDHVDAIFMNAVAFEESLPSASANGYVDANIAVLSPILDVTRQGLATILRSMWKRGSAQLFTWNSGDNPTTPTRTTTSATPKNLIDMSSTGAPSSSSAGFTIDLSNMTQLRDASSGVHVKLWVYGKDTVASNGTVTLRDSGTASISVSSFGTSFGWLSAGGYLNANKSKYDLQFSTSAGTLSVSDICCYLDGA